MNTWKEFCFHQHDVVCNQKYDKDLPYSQHLKYVEAQYHKFKGLLNSTDQYLAHMGCLGHDLIEDARITYNDILLHSAIRSVTDKQVADIIYCCTEEKGKNRDERHSDKYYEELSKNRIAIFVKLCDIIGNVKYSILTNSSMYNKHKKEHQKTKQWLYIEEFKDMFDYLDKLFEIN